MDLKTLTNLFPSHKLVMGEQFSQENISALKVKSILNWSDTIFVDCNFSEAQFHLLLLSGAIFFECDFAGAVFRACDIDGSEFISCNLTYANMHSSAVADTSFTDCVIGGFSGPQDFNCCSFIYPHYTRKTRITSPYPYVAVTTTEGPMVLFKTAKCWYIHAGSKRHSFNFGAANIPEPYHGAIEFAEKLTPQRSHVGHSYKAAKVE